MTITIDKIQEEVVKSYTSYSRSMSNEQDEINDFLDRINHRKERYVSLSKGLNKLSYLFNQITWLDGLKDSDEVLIHGMIAMGKIIDKKFREFLAEERRAFASKGLFKNEFKLLKDAIDNHKESVKDLADIILDLRKDEEFIYLSKMIDEL